LLLGGCASEDSTTASRAIVAEVRPQETRAEGESTLPANGSTAFDRFFDGSTTELVLVAEYDALTGHGRVGAPIMAALLDSGIVPFVSGSRASKIHVAAEDAERAREIIIAARARLHLDITVLELVDPPLGEQVE